MGQSGMVMSQTTNAQDMSTEPRSVSGLVREVTFIRMPSMLNPLLLGLWFVYVVFEEAPTDPLKTSDVVVKVRGEYVSILGISGGIERIGEIEVVVYNTGL